MPDGFEIPPRCQNPACNLPIPIQRGHRRRQYCDDTCKQAAYRARRREAELDRYEIQQREELQQQIAAWRARWGDLVPETLQLLATLSAGMAARVAAAIRAEVARAVRSQSEERTTLVETILFGGEQVNHPAILTENVSLAPGLDAWVAFCSYADLAELLQLRDQVYIVCTARARGGALARHT